MYIYNIGSILQPKRCIIFTWICLHLQFLYFNHSFPCSWSCSCAKTMYILEPRIESNGQIIISTKKIALNRMTVLSRYMQHISQNSWFNRSIIWDEHKVYTIKLGLATVQSDGKSLKTAENSGAHMTQVKSYDHFA